MASVRSFDANIVRINARVNRPITNPQINSKQEVFNNLLTVTVFEENETNEVVEPL